MSDPLDLLVPGGALQGPLFSRLLARIQHAPRELAVGERVGPYRIVSSLGRGGSAFVYLAQRADGEFEQQVALKVVGTGSDTAGSRELLKHERQILASLTHPHIARLLDGGSTAEGWLWFAMEPVQGVRIDRHCEARAIGRVQRLRLFGQVCDAVQFAHARLLVHRDLKPSNILVTDAGEVRLLDFGIATLLEQRSGAAVAPHAYTPGYASPEQRRGETVTTASDVWQLGRLLTDLVGATPGVELLAIVARAMHDEPSRRYGTVAELAADVLSLVERRPVSAFDGGRAYRLRCFVGRHRLAVASGVVGVAAFLGLALYSGVRIAHERDQALHEAARANAATDFLRESLWVADPSENRGDTFTVNAMLERSSQRLATELREQPELRAALLNVIGQIHIGLGQVARAEPMLRESVLLTRTNGTPDPVVLALRLRHLAQAQWRLDAFGTALESAREGYALIADLPGQVDLKARLLNTRTVCELRLGRFAESEATARRVIALVERELGPSHQFAAYAHNNLANALTQQDESIDVSPIYARALESVRARYGADHPDTLAIGVHYARALARAGHFDEAWAVLDVSKRGTADLLGTSHRNYANALEAEAELLHRRGRDTEAGPLAEQAVALHPVGPGQSATERANALQVLALIRAALGDSGAATGHWREIVVLREQALPAGHPDIVRAHLGLAGILCRGGRSDDGRAELARAHAAADSSPALPATAVAQDAARLSCDATTEGSMQAQAERSPTG